MGKEAALTRLHSDDEQKSLEVSNTIDIMPKQHKIILDLPTIYLPSVTV